MAQRRWLFAVPAVVFLGVGGRAVLAPIVSRGADRRIVDDRFLNLEAQLGYHLYAPTWLPSGGHVGSLGAMQGAKRVLQDFADSDGRSLCIVSQEPRSRDRDHYHHQLFVAKAEARGNVNGKEAYFVTGSSGERRLFWNEAKTAVILSSCTLSDDDLLKVARKMR